MNRKKSMMKSFKICIQVFLLCVILTAGVQAKRIFVPDINAPGDPSDDSLRTEALQWEEEEAPLWVAIYRNSAEVIMPPSINNNDIEDSRIYIALNRCLERWNSAGLGMDFSFNETAFYSDFLAGINPNLPLGPTEVALDRYNLITFQEPEEIVPTGVIYADYTFYFTIDIDLSDYNQLALLEQEGVIFNPTTGEIEVDVNGDGLIDIHLPRKEYEGGTIIDCDIAFNAEFTDYMLPPEDSGDLTQQQINDYLGEIDIEAHFMRALGEMLGLSPIPLNRPVMGNYLEGGDFAANPWEKRELNFADKMLATLHYGYDVPSRTKAGEGCGASPPPPGGTGGIKGMVVDGRGYYGQDDIFIIPDIPVFVGVPRDDFYITADSVFSDLGIVDLIGCSFTGVNNEVPDGVNAPDAILNSEYVLTGLPPGENYVVYIEPSEFRSYEEEYQGFLPAIPDYPAEFYGGADPPLAGDGTAEDINISGDGLITSRYLEVAYVDNGQFTVGVRQGPALLFGHPNPGTSYSSLKIVKEGQETIATNNFQEFGIPVRTLEVNDVVNYTTGTWLINNAVQLTQTLEIVPFGGPNSQLDDLRVTYIIENVSSDPVEVELRMMLDTLLGARDDAPFVINGEQVRSERLYQGATLPEVYRVLDNLEYPTIQALGTLIDPAVTLPTSFATAWWPDAFDSPFEFTPDGTFFSGENAFTQDSAVVIFWGPEDLNPGESVTYSTMYGFLSAEKIPESGVPHDIDNPTVYDDYDYVAEPIEVNANKYTENIVIITNVADPPAGEEDEDEDEDDDDEEEIDEEFPRLQDISPRVGGDALPIDVLFSLGADVGDLDNDGDLDIVVANGVINDQGPSSLINRIYLNDGTGKFTDVTFGPDEIVGTDDDRLPLESSVIGTYHVNLADFNGDGFLDIYFSNFGESVGTRVGAQNQIFINRDVDMDGIPDVMFEDETTLRLPGVMNQGSYSDFIDVSTRSDVGDIDSDGDIDIIVSNVDRYSDLAGTTAIDPIGSPNNLGTMWFSDRVLINHLNDKDPAKRGFYFTDETLGSDNLFGGNTIEEFDRFPPLMPDHPQTAPGPGNDETDFSETFQVILAPIVSDSALDVVIVNGSEIPHLYRYNGYDLVYDNIDVDGDYLPDGYFRCVNFAVDDFFITLVRNGTLVGSAQEPLWIGRPAGYPNHASIPPADADWIPQVRSNSQGGIATDLNSTGWREIVLVNPSEGVQYFDPVNPPGFEYPGATRARNGRIGGDALEYVPHAIRIYSHRTNQAGFVPELTGRRRAIAAGDFDLDGCLDLYICNDATGGDLGNVGVLPIFNQVLQNDQYGEFSDVTEVALGDDPEDDASMYAVVADFDNDGDVDIFVCNYGEQNELFENTIIMDPPDITLDTDPPLFLDKTGLYYPAYFGAISNPPYTSSYANVSTNLEFADVNMDGNIDFAVANGGVQSTSGDYTVIYLNRAEPLNQGTYVFTPSASPFPGPRIMQNGTTVFLESERSPVYDMVFADFDNDGDPDLYQSCAGTRNRIFFNTDVDQIDINSIPDNDLIGDAVFEERTVNSLPNFPVPSPEENSREVAVGDFNEDGLIDIIVANGYENYGAPNVLLLNERFPVPNGKPGKFTAPDPWVTYPNGDPYTNVDDSMEPAVADLNGDGHLDIFIANRMSLVSPKPPDFYEYCRLLFGDGNGGFVDVTETNLPLIKGNVQGVVICDFDQDGDYTEDLNGNGILDPAEDANYNKKLDWMDSNGDGRFTPDYDIFIVLYDSQNIMLENDGNGNFTDVTGLRLPIIVNDSFGADIGDVDRDGDCDIVVANQTLASEGSVQLLINDGTGVFEDISYEVPIPESVLFRTGYYDFNNNSHDVKLADIDLDGDLDMIVVNLGNMNVFPLVGSNTYVFENRLYGDGFNSRMIQKVRTPGGPVIATVSPPSARRGSERVKIRITGGNFEPGCSVNIGDGVNIIGEPVFVSDGIIEIMVDIAPDAPVGTRIISVINPDGKKGSSKSGVFRVIDGSYPKPPVKINSTGSHWNMYE